MRKSVHLLAAIVGAFTLTGCSAIQDVLSSEPERDESGAVTASETKDVFALKVGDCLNTAELGELIEEVPFIPCDEPHDSEAYASMMLPEGDYPGDDVVAAKADEFCFAEFEGFVGLNYESSVLGYFRMHPSADTWSQIHDREIMCLVYDPEGGVTGTMKNAAR